ncbi:hypothetical protein IWX90DRAFT_77750 [Phyllosticta citrichinensis]|uniref:Uncharacterized protein n=1 Tax=Phyllosticta citrichinensis TaxID=1130410 RepID=A0ABR1XGQ8_9PEZI
MASPGTVATPREHPYTAADGTRELSFATATHSPGTRKSRYWNCMIWKHSLTRCLPSHRRALSQTKHHHASEPYPSPSHPSLQVYRPTSSPKSLSQCSHSILVTTKSTHSSFSGSTGLVVPGGIATLDTQGNQQNAAIARNTLHLQDRSFQVTFSIFAGRLTSRFLDSVQRRVQAVEDAAEIGVWMELVLVDMFDLTATVSSSYSELFQLVWASLGG